MQATSPPFASRNVGQQMRCCRSRGPHRGQSAERASPHPPPPPCACLRHTLERLVREVWLWMPKPGWSPLRLISCISRVAIFLFEHLSFTVSESIHQTNGRLRATRSIDGNYVGRRRVGLGTPLARARRRHELGIHQAACSIERSSTGSGGYGEVGEKFRRSNKCEDEQQQRWRQ